MKIGNGVGRQIQAWILPKAHGIGTSAGLEARRSCLYASLNLSGDQSEIP